MVFSQKPLRFKPEPLRLNGLPLPWVEDAKYLGNTVTSIPDGLSKDAYQKRAMFIEKNVEILQEFPTAHPDVKCKINRIYNSSFPGSMVYDLTSSSVNKLMNSWSLATKHMWGLPFQTHKYFIEELGGQHAKSMILVRYIKFIQSMKKSPKMCVQFMLEKVSRNLNTVTGRNLKHIFDMTGQQFDLFSVTPNSLKRNMKFCEPDQGDKWRVRMVREITNLKQGVLELDDGGFSVEELDELLDYVTTS